MKSVNARSLTLRYMLALGLVGLCTLASHLILTRVLYHREGSAYLINVAGRQRMLSQRISSFVAQRALRDAGVDSDLAAAIDLFESNFRKLRDNSGQGSLDAIYEGDGLSADIHEYVTIARTALAMPLDDPDLSTQARKLFSLSRASLLRKLDAVVAVHQGDSERNLARLGELQTASLIVVFVTLMAEALAIFRPMVDIIVRHTGELLHLSLTDELTQLPNRRAFFDAAAIELSRARRSSQQFSLLLVDVDHFKKVNDTHGHAIGDLVLRSVSARVRQIVRPFDVFGRIGGEEFAILMPQADSDSAFTLAERVRQAVASLTIRHATTEIHVTVSIGVASYHLDIPDTHTLVTQADLALYQAKSEGRNRVVIANSQPATAHATCSDARHEL
jgi:diguanylate cyclase (GGDEF)-like protein